MDIQVKTTIERTMHLSSSVAGGMYRRLSVLSRHLGYCLFFSQLTFIPNAFSAPAGGNIVGGSGSINQAGLTTTINQNTSSLAIDWNSFNVNQSEIVNFLQPGASSIALNRVLGTNASQIFGKINANGQVVLVNPNGIFFGAGSSVNVGGLIASGLDISPNDFMNGDYIFSEVSGADGTVINGGLINASLGGNVVLLGKRVENNGVISAQLGNVSLAAGKAAVLTFDQQGLLGVRVTEAILQDELGVDPAVLNAGEINAEGGRVLLTGSVSQDVFSQAVNSAGIEQATSVVVHEDGSFTLGAGADVVNTGRLDVSTHQVGQNGGQVVALGDNVTSSGVIKADASNGDGGMIEIHAQTTSQLTDDSQISAQASGNGQGGVIKVLGDNVGLFDNSQVDASGAIGGGQVFIGGGQQGLNAQLPNADFIYLGEHSSVNANALDHGDGGRIIAFASDTARFYGDLSARGGINRGDGGFIETSGLKNFQINKTPDISAPNGTGGEWLIDPNDILIVGGGGNTNINNSNPFATTNSSASLGVNLIIGALTSGANVTITTGTVGTNADAGNITFNTNLNYNNGVGANTLTLNATNNIDTSGNDIIDSTPGDGDSLNLILNANSDGDIVIGGNVIITNSNIDTNGGDFLASGVNFTSIRSGSSSETIDTAGGNVALNFTGAIDINAEILTEGGNFTVTNANSFNNNDANGEIDVSPTSNGPGGTVMITSVGNVDLGVIDIASSGATTTSGNVTVNSGGNIVLHSDFDSEWGNDTTLTLIANNDITLNGIILDTAPSDQDIVNVVLTADNDNSGAGNVTVNANVNTSGGDFTASGVGFVSTGMTIDTTVSAATTNSGHVTLNMTGITTLGGITTETGAGNGNFNITAGGAITDASGNLDINGNTSLTAGVNNITLDNGNDFNGDVRVVSGNNVTLNDINAIALGSGAGVSTVTGALTVSAGDNITNNGALSVTGTSSFITTGNNDDITLNNNANNLQGDINFATTGNGGDISLTNSAAVTNIGTVTTAGNLTILASNGLNLNGTITNSYSGGGTRDIGLNFGSASASIFNFNAAGIVNGSGSGSINVAINSASNANIFNFNAGSSIASLSGGGIVVTGGSNIDTFNLSTNIAGTINAGAGADIFNINATGVTVANLNGDADLDVLNGFNGVNDWIVTGSNQGTLNATSNFQSVESLVGGSAIDTLTGPNSNVIWTIGSGVSNLASGTNLLGTGFSNFENYTGQGGTDTFNVGALGTFSVIDGGGNSDSLDVSASAINIITIGTSAIAVESVTGNNSVNSALVAADVNNDWTIDGVNAGSVLDVNNSTTVSFTGFNNVTGNNQQDVFQFQTGGLIGGTIDAAGGSSDEVDYSNLASVSIALASAFSGVIGAETIRGNNADSTLIGNDVDTTWTIVGTNSGTVGGINFIGFNNLTGGTADDTFSIGVSGDIEGTINGGLQNLGDVVDYSSAASVNISLSSGFNGVIGAETLQGNNTNSTLSGNNIDTTWTINGQNDGTVAGINFINFNNLTGGTADDSFVFTATGAITGLITGGTAITQDTVDLSLVPMVSVTLGSGIFGVEQITGNNTNSTLFGDNANNSWAITGVNDGAVAGIDFIDFNNLTGGSADDTFVLNAASAITGTIDGGNQIAGDVIDYSAIGSISVSLASGLSGVTNVETIQGNNTDSTLIGNNVNNTWDITGANDGSVGGVNFIDFNHLTGGSANDDFVFAASGSLTGLITGGAATTQDTVDLSLQPVVSVTLGQGIFGVEQITGNNIDSTLTSSNVNTTWTIDGANTGTVAGIRFIDFNNLAGGTADDNFVLNMGGSIADDIDGGGHIFGDIVNYSANTGTLEISLASGGVFSGVINAETIQGNNTDSTLIGDNVDAIWTITGVNDGNVAGINFINFNNLTGGAADDSFVFNAAGSITDTINGGNHNLGDSVDFSALASVTINAAIGIAGVINIEQIIGNNTDSTLTGANSANIWSVTGANTGTLNGFTFSGFNNLIGGSNDDSFTYGASGSTSGQVSGGGQITEDTVNLSALANASVNLNNSSYSGIERFTGNDLSSTLIAANTNNSWNINGNNDGDVNGINFVDFNNLIGGSGDDSFIYAVNGAITGTINGGGQVLEDSVNLAALTMVNVDLSTSSFVSIELFTGNDSNSTLTGNNINNSWSITNNNDGSLAGINFVDFNNVTGGSANDTFTYGLNGLITGTVNGGGQVSEDRVIQSALTTVSIDLSNGSFANIERFTGNNTASTFIAANGANNWGITGANDGIVNGVNFVDFNNITGGNGDDSFVYNVAGSVTGAVDGGSQVTQDSVDLSALATVNVDLGSSQFLNIELFTGNNATSTLTATNGNNSWGITGINDGDVNGINFVDFNNVTGGNGVDTFSVSGNGSLTGLASGGQGNDIANVTLTGIENGNFTFDGGSDSDTVILIGGNASYQGQYSSNVSGSEQLSYSQAGNNYAVNYTQIETINDNLTSANLTVNGTAANDTINLGSNNFTVNTATIVSHTGNANLTVDGQTGIDTITSTVASTISANTLLLTNIDTIGSVGNAISTNINQLNLDNITGDIYLNELNQIDLGQLDNLVGNLTLSNQSGDIQDSAALASSANVILTAQNGNILLDNANQLGGELSLVAINGNVILNNTQATQLANISAQNLTITSNGNITDTMASQINVTGATTLMAAGSDITLDGSNQVFTSVAVSNAANLTLVDSNASGLSIASVNVNGDARLSSTGSLSANQIIAGGIASLTTGGSVIDNNGGANNVTAATLEVAAVSGIGDGNAIETQVDTMDVNNTGSGNIDLAQTGVINLVGLKNTGSSGNITLNANSNINFNPGSVVANRSSGDLLIITSGGSFFGLGVGSLSNPDITAQNATFIGRAGTFGSFQRPITLDVPGSVLIDTRASFNPQFVPPGPSSLVVGGIDLSLLGSISLASELLVEVESLGEIDEAIFTNLQNYATQDVSILMPQDQRFDDEDEDEEEDEEENEPLSLLLQ